MSLDSSGRSPLHYAALDDDVEQARALLTAGADPNLADAQRLTPLHFAAQAQAERTAKVLLDHGASVSSTDLYGNTPLWTAVFNYRGKGNIIALVRAYGADPYHRNRAGRCPLDLARLIANYPVAQFFSDLPADDRSNS